MKARNLKLTSILLALMSYPALAEMHDFSEIDADADGALSITEASDSLPDLAIVDTNGDGMVNPAEVEAVVPGLMLVTSEDKANGIITEAEYQLIVAAVEARDSESESENSFGGDFG